MPFLQLTGFLKKTFRGHGEKLRWILGAIGVQDRFPAVFSRPAELLKFRAQDPGPRLVAMAHLREGCPFKERCAVNQAVLLIELVGKLVYDHVPVPVQFQRSGDGPIPRQNHGSVRPGFSASRLLAFGNCPAIVFQTPGSGDVTGGIDQNAAQAGVIVRVPVEQQQAGLRYNQHPDLIGNLLPVTTLEPFFLKEDKDVAF